MLCKKAEGKEAARNLLCHPLGDFRHPLKISLPPLKEILKPPLHEYVVIDVFKNLFNDVGADL